MTYYGVFRPLLSLFCEICLPAFFFFFFFLTYSLPLSGPVGVKKLCQCQDEYASWLARPLYNRPDPFYSSFVSSKDDILIYLPDFFLANVTGGNVDCYSFTS